MKVHADQLDTFSEVSKQLRACTWDIFSNWLEETQAQQSREQKGLDDYRHQILDNLPTLIGGLTKVIEDPMFLMDLEAGGRLFETAKQYGDYQHEAGFSMEKVLNDFSLLREKLWLFCEKFVPSDDRSLFELERRLNIALDRIIVISVESYHNRSSAEMLELAQRDKLTGFLHMKAFHRTLDREIIRAKRYRLPLTLVYPYIDNFKRFNIEEGRLEGNQLLREVAREIANVVRASDYSARLGGDEFAIILPHTNIVDAKRSADRIRRAVRKVRRDDNRVTISLGLASFPDHASDNTSLIEQAGLALNCAEEDGGDAWDAAS